MTFATSSGSVENLNVSAFHGLIPKSFHAWAIVTWLTFNRAASSRLDQCVTPRLFGGGVNVASTIRRGSTVRGRPGRSSSASPANPRSRYRFRHRSTVGRDTPTNSAISTFGVPSAASNTIRARIANPARTDDARASRTNSASSFSRNNSAAARRTMPHHPTQK